MYSTCFIYRGGGAHEKRVGLGGPYIRSNTVGSLECQLPRDTIQKQHKPTCGQCVQEMFAPAHVQIYGNIYKLTKQSHTNIVCKKQSVLRVAIYTNQYIAVSLHFVISLAATCMCNSKIGRARPESVHGNIHDSSIFDRYGVCHYTRPVVIFPFLQRYSIANKSGSVKAGVRRCLPGMVS